MKPKRDPYFRVVLAVTGSIMFRVQAKDVAEAEKNAIADARKQFPGAVKLEVTSINIDGDD